MKQRVRLLAILIISIILVGLVAAFILSQRVPTDDPKVQDNNLGALDTFPILVGTDLLFNTIHIPTDLDPGPKLIVTAYDIEQRTAAYEWLVPLEQLNVEFPQLSGYFVPLFPKNMSNGAAMLIGGMAIVVGDDWDHKNMIVVFTDVEEFNEMVGVDSQETLQLFLVDDTDHIVWRTSAGVDEKKLADLRIILGDLLER